MKPGPAAKLLASALRARYGTVRAEVQRRGAFGRYAATLPVLALPVKDLERALADLLTEWGELKIDDPAEAAAEARAAREARLQDARVSVSQAVSQGLLGMGFKAREIKRVRLAAGLSEEDQVMEAMRQIREG